MFAVFKLRDATAIVLIDAFTSIFAGIAVFSILGYIAVNQGKEVKDVVTQGIRNYGY